MEKDKKYLAIPFEYYSSRAAKLPLPEKVISFCCDDGREVVIFYAVEKENVAAFTGDLYT